MSSKPAALALALGWTVLIPIGAVAAPGWQTLKLSPDDGGGGDEFGTSVGVSGATAVIGSPLDDDNGVDSGAAYLFDTTTGLQLFKLLPGDGAAEDEFGSSVGISGAVAIVGAAGDDDNGVDSGSAYLFDTTTGLQIMKLLPEVGAVGDQFGFAVGISGTTAIVGAKADEFGTDSGVAYLFDTTTGQQLAKLVPDDGEALDLFGWSVAIDGTTAVVGAYRDDDNGIGSGSAYVFDATTGFQIVKLLPDVGGEFSGFGWSVAISGATAMIGSVHDDAAGSGAGAAYLFDTTTGDQLALLVANDALVEDSLGYSVAISGATPLAGAPFDNQVDPDVGSAYLFDPVTQQQVAKLVPSGLAPFDGLGSCVAIDGVTALVGAPNDDDLGQNSGAVYVFDVGQGLAVPYCFGAGAGTPCPCLNAGAHGHGCANSAFAAGARLSGEGSACVSADSFALKVVRSRPNQPGLFFQGDDALNGGSGFLFGDGLRCAGTNVFRLQVVTAQSNGAASSTVSIAAAMGLSPGDVKRYQWWYRDPVVSLCGSGLNLSNGLEVVWGP